MITMSGLASHIQVAEGFLQKLRASTPFSSGWSIEPGRYPPVKENTQFTFTFRKEK